MIGLLSNFIYLFYLQTLFPQQPLQTSHTGRCGNNDTVTCLLQDREHLCYFSIEAVLITHCVKWISNICCVEKSSKYEDWSPFKEYYVR